jgi:hypothetical protein
MRAVYFAMKARYLGIRVSYYFQSKVEEVDSE